MKRIVNLTLKILISLLIINLLSRLIRKYVDIAPDFAYRGYVFDSGIRKKLFSPGNVVKRSGIQPGMRVLEVGCGSGAYTTAIARAVGNTGHVVAIEPYPPLIGQFRRKLADPTYKGLQNINISEADAASLPFADDQFDLVCAVTVIPEIRHLPQALAEIKRVLKPGGIFAESEQLIDPDMPRTATAVAWLRQAGFDIQDVRGNLWTYTVIGSKPVLLRGL